MQLGLPNAVTPAASYASLEHLLRAVCDRQIDELSHAN